MRVNIPNMVTLSRVPILFAIVLLLFVTVRGTATAALCLFCFAAWTDWLDGHLARKQGLVSNFGKLMDALTDKILVVGMFVTLLVLEILPSWAVFCVLLILAREFLITGLRLVAASHGKVLAAERGGKWKTVCQLVAIIAFMLWYALIRDFGLPFESALLGLLHGLSLAVFLLATFLTVSSGGQYLWKYWDVFLSEPDRP